MKIRDIKYIKYMAVFALLISVFSCREGVEDKFQVPPSERVANLIKKCDATLRSSKNGWICDYESGRGDKFRFWLDFQKKKRLVILSDFDKEMTTSSYTYNASQGAVLSFSTYSVWHKLADPQYAATPSENSGKSFEGDYEFVIHKVYRDSIICEGLKRHNKVVFVRAVADSKSKIEQNNKKIVPFVKNIRKVKVKGLQAPFIVVKKADESVIGLGATMKNRFVSTTWNTNSLGFETVEKDGVKYKKGEVVVKPIEEGFEVEPALDVNGVSVTKFIWNEDKEMYVAENDKTITIAGSILPFIPDQDAVSKIKIASSISYMSNAFYDEYYIPLKESIEKYEAFQLWYGYTFDDGSKLRCLTIKSEIKPNYHNAYMKPFETVGRPDVVRFVFVGFRKGSVWKDLKTGDSRDKMYNFFFGKGQEFLITHPREGVVKFTNLKNPKYWVKFKAYDWAM